MNRCTKGLHEMTEENTYRDRKGRRHCRGCKNQRKRNLKAHHKAETFSLKRTAMDEALEKQPPSIEWRKTRGGVWVAVSVRDPHAETEAQRAWDERMAREEAVLAAMEDEARRVADRFERHRADNTPLLAAARTEI